MLGEVRPVLWEGKRGESGLTDNYIKVRFEAVEKGRGGDGLIERVELSRIDADGAVVASAI